MDYNLLKLKKGQSKTSHDFRNRAISTVVAVPVIGAVVWFGQPWLLILAALWGMGAVWEFYRLVKFSSKVCPLTYFGILWTLLFIMSGHFTDILPLHILLATAVIFPLVWLLGRRGKDNAFLSWVWTIGGILYVGWLMSYVVGLRDLPGGRDWVFVAIFASFGSDILAYLVGRAAGKHKLAPNISPKKSWEGAMAGVLGSIITSFIIVLVLRTPVAYWHVVVLGIIISVVGQFGDLVKSLFKRNTGVKDSGKVLPGHGGFLDRMDSLAFAGVAAFYYVSYVLAVS